MDGVDFFVLPGCFFFGVNQPVVTIVTEAGCHTQDLAMYGCMVIVILILLMIVSFPAPVTS